ncbi:hypothetical protein Dda_3444 [Drechslerella dactyloides]|uniref:Uncharacterized protein n=1 Tax=Drechslerella dactyloides TaxID=74499 RepID=A0AAD6J5U5_DREDA|nr:hypothetical protein Dda_3444 [Drechslerella dactyloides]
MSALPFAATRLARSALAGTNGSALRPLCLHCRVPQQHLRSNLEVATGQRRYLKITWGNKEHVPHVRTRKGQRQKLIEAGRKGEGIAAPKMTQDELRDLYSSELFVFRTDVAAGNVPLAMQALENLTELEVLGPRDTCDLAQALHQAYRSKKLEKPTVKNYMKTIIEYLKAGRLPTHYMAQVHVLSTLKEMEEWRLGNEYWGWLKLQGTQYLDARVFGAVIEYLVYQGAPLKELENLHQLALEKYSTVEDDGGGMHHRATKLMLLQGILTARVIHGEWKGAYELLDICTRLHPTQVPSRIYELFLLNRSPEEGYLVFLMACRAGTKLSTKAVTFLSTNYWKCTNDTKGILRIFLAHLAAGGKMEPQVLNKIIFCLLGRLPDAPQPPEPLESLSASSTTGPTLTVEEERVNAEKWQEWDRKMTEYQEAVNPMFDTIRRAIELFRLVGIEPGVITYNTIISQASRRHLRNIVVASMAEAETLAEPVDENIKEANLRVALTAFGDLRDKEGLKKTWEQLTDFRRAYLRDRYKFMDGRTWTGKRRAWTSAARDHDLISWKSLIRAGFNAGMKPYVLEQLQRYENEFDSSLSQDIRTEIARCEGRVQKSFRLQKETESDAKAAVEPPRMSNAFIPGADFAGLKAEVEEYNHLLELMEVVYKSPVMYEFSTLDLIDLKALGLPEMTAQDVEDLKPVYEHFQTNMPRNPYLTATHDPKTDLAGLMLTEKQLKAQQKEKEAKTEQTPGEWGEVRSLTGYTANQLRFENWLTINRLLFLADKIQITRKWRPTRLGVKGVTSGQVRREARARELIERMEGLQGAELEAAMLQARLDLVGDVEGDAKEGSDEATTNGAAITTTETEAQAASA